MDFSISPGTSELVGRLRHFMEAHVFPLEAQAAGQSFRSLLPSLNAVRGRAMEEGLWGPQIPRAYGGMGLGFMDQAHFAEQLGQSPFGHFTVNAQAPDAGNMEILLEFGTDEQKRLWLEPLARGEIRSCFAMTEPDRAGSNPVWMDTRAVRENDQYVINGRKWFTSAADGARFAIVMAVTDPDAPPHQRASQIIVPTESAGFKLERNISCMGHEGDGWASHGEVSYTNCRVPVANRLGAEGAGFAIAQARLGPGRIHHCMRWIGISQRCFDLMCRHALKRELAPGEPLAGRQTVQNWIAESRAEIDAARLMVLKAAWMIDHGMTNEARIEISTIKFFVAGVMTRVIDRAIQVHGALGITDDTILSTFYRQERGARIYDGPDEVHKAVVAKRILKGYLQHATEPDQARSQG